jgi:hypothetical protein
MVIYLGPLGKLGVFLGLIGFNGGHLIGDFCVLFPWLLAVVFDYVMGQNGKLGQNRTGCSTKLFMGFGHKVKEFKSISSGRFGKYGVVLIMECVIGFGPQ